MSFYRIIDPLLEPFQVISDSFRWIVRKQNGAIELASQAGLGNWANSDSVFLFRRTKICVADPANQRRSHFVRSQYKAFVNNTKLLILEGIKFKQGIAGVQA